MGEHRKVEKVEDAVLQHGHYLFEPCCRRHDNWSEVHTGRATANGSMEKKRGKPGGFYTLKAPMEFK